MPTTPRVHTPARLALTLSLSLCACGAEEGAKRPEGAEAPAPAKASPRSPAAQPATPAADGAGFPAFKPGEAPVELGALELAFAPIEWNPERAGFVHLGGTATITVTKPVKKFDAVIFKAACELDGELVMGAAPLILDAVEPGAPHEDEPSLFEADGVKAAPERCEISVLFHNTITSDTPRLIESRCLQGGTMTRGPCEQLTRPEPGDAPVSAVGVPTIALRERADEKSLEYSLRLRRGRGLPSGAAPVSVKMQCTVRGETEEKEYSGPQTWSYTLPGESLTDSAALTFADGAAAPTKCDMRFAVEPSMAEPVPLGRFCYEDGETRAGACG